MTSDRWRCPHCSATFDHAGYTLAMRQAARTAAVTMRGKETGNCPACRQSLGTIALIEGEYDLPAIPPRGELIAAMREMLMSTLQALALDGLSAAEMTHKGLNQTGHYFVDKYGMKLDEIQDILREIT